MAELQYGNPMEFTEEQLKAAYLKTWYLANGNFHHSAVADVLVSEMNRRAILTTNAENARLTKVANEDNKKSATQNLRISLLAVGLSLISLLFVLVSVAFSYLTWKGDKDWQIQQLSLLKQIGKELGPSSDKISINK
ncbi:MAG: hypothetical protein ACYCPQ_07660 [Elusimicrobiota bacterium]